MRILKQFPTTGTLLVCFALLLLGMEALGGSDSVRVLYSFGAMTIDAIQRGETWRFVTPMFLHIGLMHLAFNGFALFQLGPLCERIFGPARFLLIFVLCGMAGNMLSFALNDDNVIVAGASGAIFGLVGCLITTAWYQKTVIVPRARRALIRGLSPFVAYNFIFGLMIDGIDNWNHLGGLLMGGLLGLTIKAGRVPKIYATLSWLTCAVIITWAAHQQWNSIGL